MLLAARNGNIEEINRLLNPDVNLKNNKGETALMMASKYSNDTSSLETVRLLLDQGADVNLKTNDGWSALSFLISKVLF